MKAMRVLDAKEWAVETFAKVELGDPRRRDRVVQVALLRLKIRQPCCPAKWEIAAHCKQHIPPKNGGALHKQAVEGWVVRVWEPNPPGGEEPLEWVLLTSFPVESVPQAWQCVDWYTMRWNVEDFHK